MRHLRTFALLVLAFLLVACGPSAEGGALEAAARRVASGEAVLVDVREPAEWRSTGVAEPALLLSKSSFEAGSAEWREFLTKNRDKEIILMCRSGNRSGQMARVLTQQGLRTTNLGAFSTWKSSGLPTREVP